MAELTESEFNKGIDRLGRMLGGRSGGNSSYSPPSSSSFMPSFDLSKPKDLIIKTFESVNKSAEQTMGEWRQATADFGISFNNDAIALRTSIGQTRMSFDEWSDSIAIGKQGFTSLGGTMSDSAKVFNKVSARLTDEFGDSLSKMGVTTGEYNKILALTITNNKRLDLTTQEGQHAAAESANAMAKEMDKVTQLSGLSRKAQIDKMEADKSDMRYQAARMLKEREGLNVTGLDTARVFSETSGLGDLFKNLVEGGPKTEKSIAQLQLIGGDIAQKFEQSLKDIETAVTPEQKAAAQANFEAINAEAAARMFSTENLKVATTNTSQWADHWRETLLLGKNTFEGLEAQAKKGKLGAEQTVEAAQQLTDKINNAQQGLDEKGMRTGGFHVTDALNLMGKRVDDVGAKLSLYMGAAGQSFGRNVVAAAGINELLKGYDPKTKQSFRMGGESQKQILESINKDKFIGNIDDIMQKTVIPEMTKDASKIISSAIEMTGKVAGVKTQEIPKPPVVEKPKQEFEVTPKILPPDENLNKINNFFKDTLPITINSSLDKEKIKQSVNVVGVPNIIPNDEQIKKINDFFSEKMESIKPLVSSIEPIPTPTNYTFTEETKSKPESTDKEPNVQEPMQFKTVDISLKDINDQLTVLNSNMGKLVSNSIDMLDNSTKQYRATKNLSPNLNAM